MMATFLYRSTNQLPTPLELTQRRPNCVSSCREPWRCALPTESLHARSRSSNSMPSKHPVKIHFRRYAAPAAISAVIPVPWDSIQSP